MFDNEKRSRIERARKGLYSRDGVGDDYNLRRTIHAESKHVQEDWQAPEPRTPVFVDKDRRTSFSKIILIGSLVFFIVAAGAALYAFFGGNHLVSVDNIDIVVEGPASIAGGDVARLNVSVMNKNATAIELVDLIAEFPSGTKKPSNMSEDLIRERLSLGTIPAGGISLKNLEAVIFGVENEEKEVKFTVEYRTRDSNAIFFKEKTYKMIVASSPVLVDIDALEQISSGQETEIEVTVISNSTSPVENLILVLEYPFGFSYIEGKPAPIFSNNVFSVGDLAPTTKRTFIVRGIFSAEDGEERVLRANIGIEKESNEREIATTIMSAEHAFLIEKPFIGLDLAFNGSLSGDYPAEPGKQVRTDIRWTNNLPVRVANGVVEVKITSNVLDKNSVSPLKGIYNSSVNTIIWDSRSNPSLALIAPGDKGELSFSFAPLRFAPGQYPTNSEIQVSVSFKGTRVDEENSIEMLSGQVVRSVKLSSALALGSASYYSSELFPNTGPMPPKADERTTYTIVWTIASASNSMSDAEVRAVLPPYVEWMDVVSPDADIRFNPVGGEVIWNVGDIQASGSGSVSEKLAAFQIAITPSITQTGKILNLVGKVTATARDDFSDQTVRGEALPVSTFTSDPGSTENSGTVDQ